MALTWSHSGWRLLTDFAASRNELVLHIQEIENRIGGLESQGAMDQHARWDIASLERMLSRREANLHALDAALGMLPGESNQHPFVGMRPVQ